MLFVIYIIVAGAVTATWLWREKTDVIGIMTGVTLGVLWPIIVYVAIWTAVGAGLVLVMGRVSNSLSNNDPYDL